MAVELTFENFACTRVVATHYPEILQKMTQQPFYFLKNFWVVRSHHSRACKILKSQLCHIVLQCVAVCCSALTIVRSHFA